MCESRRSPTPIEEPTDALVEIISTAIYRSELYL